MAILTVASYLTKRVNKVLAPNFLRWSLRVHDSLSSSRLPLPHPASISMLPLAQRIVSIEVQDDYRQLVLPPPSNNNNNTNNFTGQISNSWDDFVDNAWNVFFEDRHQKAKKTEQLSNEVEKEAQRRWDAKQKRRQQKRQVPLAEGGNIDELDDDVLALGKQRVQLLEQYLRPALLPTESFGDFHRSLFQHHLQPSNDYDNFIKWIRGEYLIAKYGAIVQRAIKQYPELKDDAAGLNSGGVVAGVQTIHGEEVEVPLDMILPSVDTVREAFGMQDWSRSKVSFSSWEDEERKEGDQSSSDDAASTRDLSIENIIHQKLHGQISHSGPMNAYFEMRRREDSYELWTRDYIFGLANYLLKRIEELDGRSEIPKETIILDVGAGDGRLVYFLRRAMKEVLASRNNPSISVNIQRKQGKGKSQKTSLSPSSSQPSVKLPMVIATDDGSWNAPIYNNKHIPVEQLSTVAALNKYGPNQLQRNSADSLDENEKMTRLIVLCSWMPPGQDWTADFRQSLLAGGEARNGGEGLAEEYILIGESDDGTCGHNWHTWGNPDFYPHEEKHQHQHHDAGKQEEDNVPIVPYLRDGYSRVELEDLSLLQFSRFDCEKSSESKTVSFRRGQKNV